MKHNINIVTKIGLILCLLNANAALASVTGSTAGNPYLPSNTTNNVLTFTSPSSGASGAWFDPPQSNFVNSFIYNLYGGATFTEVAAPPASFGFASVNVIVNNVIVDILAAGNSANTPTNYYTFASGVTAFTLEGISPLVNANSANTTAFPTFLKFSGTATSLTMTPANITIAVPEPAAIWLFSLAITGFLGFNRRKLIKTE